MVRAELKIAGGLLAALLASAPAARADVIFSFVQTGSSPAGTVAASGGFTVSDAAFLGGGSAGKTSTNPSAGNLGALLGLSFTAGANGGPSLTATLANFRADPPPGSFLRYSIGLSWGPSGLPTGQVRYNNTLSDFTFNFNDGNVTGTFSSDDGRGGCGRSFTCTFTGVTTVSGAPVAVPEPASAALFALGTLALGAALRRRAPERPRA